MKIVMMLMNFTIGSCFNLINFSLKQNETFKHERSAEEKMWNIKWQPNH